MDADHPLAFPEEAALALVGAQVRMLELSLANAVVKLDAWMQGWGEAGGVDGAELVTRLGQLRSMCENHSRGAGAAFQLLSEVADGVSPSIEVAEKRRASARLALAMIKKHGHGPQEE